MIPFLDLRRIKAYPIPTRELFTIEVLLRATAAMEMLIVLLGGFVVGNSVGTIAGAIGDLDQVPALICVALIETAVRLRGQLRRLEANRLALQLLDMARMGLLYGLLIDGFKLL